MYFCLLYKDIKERDDRQLYKISVVTHAPMTIMFTYLKWLAPLSKSSKKVSNSLINVLSPILVIMISRIWTLREELSVLDYTSRRTISIKASCFCAVKPVS